MKDTIYGPGFATPMGPGITLPHFDGVIVTFDGWE